MDCNANRRGFGFPAGANPMDRLESTECVDIPRCSEACIAPNYCKDTSTDRDNLSAECSACTDFGYISFGSDANA
jgi:hypothetical protein